jgi:hypothetical protein
MNNFNCQNYGNQNYDQIILIIEISWSNSLDCQNYFNQIFFRLLGV